MVNAHANVSAFRLFIYKFKVRGYRRLVTIIRDIYLGILRFQHNNHPVPLNRFFRLNKLLKHSVMKHPLSPEPKASSGGTLRHPILAKVLSSYELGKASLTVDTLDFLENEIREKKPRLILEFGSGISTVCLAQYMKDLYGITSTVRVISLEQDEYYANRTLKLLQEFQLCDHVRVFHAPLQRQCIEGRTVTTYSISDTIAQEISVQCPDFVLVDGPIGGGNVRFGTLPLVNTFVAPDTHFYLDDALRDWELSIARQWQDLPYVQILGIRVVGKGLLIGHLTGEVRCP